MTKHNWRRIFPTCQLRVCRIYVSLSFLLLPPPLPLLVPLLLSSFLSSSLSRQIQSQSHRQLPRQPYLYRHKRTDRKKQPAPDKCQNICQIEYQSILFQIVLNRTECQKTCQIKCQNICQAKCQTIYSIS